MKKLRKLLGIAMVLAFVFNTLAIGASAVLGDGNELSANINLQVGKYVVATKTFTKLAAGETLATNQVIAVRICPQTDFFVGNSRYVVMFDKTYFELVQPGTANDAFTPNSDVANLIQDPDDLTWSTGPAYTGNTYFGFACSGYAAQTSGLTWPATFVANESTTYNAVAVQGLADSNSKNGGLPELMADVTWLFQFELKALKPVVAGSDARIWMDSRWFRSSADNSLPAYLQKGTEGLLISTPGQGYTNLAFNFDFAGADIKLALPGGVVTSTITFDSAGGTAVANLVGNVGDAVVAPANPTRLNYFFKDWNPALPATFPAGGLAVTARWILIGDINFDGYVYANDALRALRISTGALVATGDALIAADVNHDGNVFANDALRILRYSTGANTVWPA
ncbi:MAG: dockerin type I domain-containing protein [Eubacteriales bacterium]